VALVATSPPVAPQGWKYETFGHLFVDTTFEGGAGFDSVSFDGIRNGRYDFSVGWMLDVTAPPGATVTIRDKSGEQVFSGDVPANGKLSVPLVEYVRSAAGKDARTPHTVAAVTGGRTVTKTVAMDRRQALDMTR
jgi:hypothetical protein